MNVFNFTGNLGRDAETKYAPSGDAIVSFSVAVKAGYGDKEKTTWIRCTMFGKRGEAVAQYLTKGQLVGVSGEFHLNEYTGKDGTAKASAEVRVSDLTLLGKKSDNSADVPAPQPASRPSQPQKTGSKFIDESEDIPF
jgi:single-strand DNA-binding protein